MRLLFFNTPVIHMKLKRHQAISRSIRLLCFLLFVHTPRSSPAAEVIVGNVCWYTVDTILKLWSSGFASDLNNKIQERQRYDALLRDIIARFEAAHTTATIESTDASKRATPHDENDPVTTEITSLETAIIHTSSCPQTTDTYHGDHIEAFKDNFEGSPRNVLSVDGRSLSDKLKKAIQDGRTYKPR